MPRQIIEFSGPDYMGKSTQADMLTFETWDVHVHNFGSFGGYGEGIPKNLSARESFDWWFVTSSLDEMVNALTSAYIDRNHQASKSDVDVAVYERGRSAIKAQIVANFATRVNGNVADYIETVCKLVDAKLANLSDETLRTEVFLKPDGDWQLAQQKHQLYARNTSAPKEFTDSQNQFYGLYLKNLEEVLNILMDKDDVSLMVDRPAVDVNNSLRMDERILEGKLPQLLQHDPLIIGLSGMSESGKSQVADLLATEHGFSRLKLGYFNESQRAVNEKYANPNKIAMQVTHFLSTNRHLARVSFESLYGPEVSADLKLLLGERWKSVYIELDQATRIERLRKQNPDTDDILLLQQQTMKDVAKIAAGVETYRDYADVVVDNSGTASQTAARIMEGIA